MKRDLATRRRFLGTTAKAVGGLSAASILGGPIRAADGGRIQIGQIGVGHGHAEGKMRVFRKSPDFEVVGVVEPDPELRKRAARSRTYRDLRWMTRDELLETPGLRAVAVETSVRDLLSMAELCVEAGMHIHLDKPAGTSFSRYKRIVETAASKGLTIQMGYMYRYNPAILLLKKLLSNGWLGEVFEIHTVMSKVASPQLRRDMAEFKGGMMFELGCHLIDLVVGILGRPDSVTPYAQHASEIDDGLTDNMLAVCAYPRAFASVKSSAMEVEGFARRHLAVCGTRGTIHVQPLDAPSVRLALDRERGEYKRGYQEIAFGNYERYVGDAADFAKIIRGEKAADYSSAHDLAVQETVLRASGMPLE